PTTSAGPATAMATSRATKGAGLISVAIASLIALTVGALLLFSGSSRVRGAPGATEPAGSPIQGQFAWLHPGPAPAGWVEMTTPASGATLTHPPGWEPIPGDPGTVTASLRGSHGSYAGYLNAPPRQRPESLQHW